MDGRQEHHLHDQACKRYDTDHVRTNEKGGQRSYPVSSCGGEDSRRNIGVDQIHASHQHKRYDKERFARQRVQVPGYVSSRIQEDDVTSTAGDSVENAQRPPGTRKRNSSTPSNDVRTKRASRNRNVFGGHLGLVAQTNRDGNVVSATTSCHIDGKSGGDSSNGTKLRSKSTVPENDKNPGRKFNEVCRGGDSEDSGSRDGRTGGSDLRRHAANVGSESGKRKANNAAAAAGAGAGKKGGATGRRPTTTTQLSRIFHYSIQQLAKQSSGGKKPNVTKSTNGSRVGDPNSTRTSSTTNVSGNLFYNAIVAASTSTPMDPTKPTMATNTATASFVPNTATTNTLSVVAKLGKSSPQDLSTTSTAIGCQPDGSTTRSKPTTTKTGCRSETGKSDGLKPLQSTACSANSNNAKDVIQPVGNDPKTKTAGSFESSKDRQPFRVLRRPNEQPKSTTRITVSKPFEGGGASTGSTSKGCYIPPHKRLANGKPRYNPSTSRSDAIIDWRAPTFTVEETNGLSNVRCSTEVKHSGTKSREVITKRNAAAAGRTQLSNESTPSGGDRRDNGGGRNGGNRSRETFGSGRFRRIEQRPQKKVFPIRSETNAKAGVDNGTIEGSKPKEAQKLNPKARTFIPRNGLPSKRAERRRLRNLARRRRRSLLLRDAKRIVHGHYVNPALLNNENISGGTDKADGTNKAEGTKPSDSKYVFVIESDSDSVVTANEDDEEIFLRTDFEFNSLRNELDRMMEDPTDIPDIGWKHDSGISINDLSGYEPSYQKFRSREKSTDTMVFRKYNETETNIQISDLFKLESEMLIKPPTGKQLHGLSILKARQSNSLISPPMQDLVAVHFVDERGTPMVDLPPLLERLCSLE